MTKRLADWVRAGESQVCVSQFGNPGWAVKVGCFAPTCGGCWKTQELIRSCCSSGYSFPTRGQGLFLHHLSHFSHQQQILAPASAVLPMVPSVTDAACAATVWSHLSGNHFWQQQAKNQRDRVLKVKEYYMNHFNLSPAQQKKKKANHQTLFSLSLA